MAAVSNGTHILVLDHLVLAEKPDADPKMLTIATSCMAPYNLTFPTKAARDAFFDAMKAVLPPAAPPTP